ncbi:MAG TPA: hypothetical protein VKG92_11645 [Flavobacteriales bacterium]|nr:hypothetical protein [Flavobacteriales bacterium]
MKNPIALLAFFTLLATAGCRDEPSPKPPPEPPPAQPTPPPKGTTVNVGEGGVEVQSQGGDVRVSPDSAHIEIKPK